jgi:homoserine O-succinyltransferase
MDEERAIHQDIRPLQILILNLMPLKEATELQLLRCLSNSPVQIDITFMIPATHRIKTGSISHINKFYVTFDDIRREYYDGMIITGAPIEMMEFEEVDYWDELCEILDWGETHVTSTMFQCWSAQAAMYHFYGIRKKYLDEKMFGLFEHQVHNRKIPLVRGFDDVFLCPHSRHTEIPMDEIRKHPEIMVLTDSCEAGSFLGMADNGRKIFVQGHPEYDRLTLDAEYKRDQSKGMNTKMPQNYYPDNDPQKKPLLRWRAISAALYANWINYYVYQATPYDMYGTPDFK